MTNNQIFRTMWTQSLPAYGCRQLAVNRPVSIAPSRNARSILPFVPVTPRTTLHFYGAMRDIRRPWQLACSVVDPFVGRFRLS